MSRSRTLTGLVRRGLHNTAPIAARTRRFPPPPSNYKRTNKKDDHSGHNGNGHDPYSKWYYGTGLATLALGGAYAIASGEAQRKFKEIFPGESPIVKHDIGIDNERCYKVGISPYHNTEAIRDFVKSIKLNSDKDVIINGPAGSGKTEIAKGMSEACREPGQKYTCIVISGHSEKQTEASLKEAAMLLGMRKDDPSLNNIELIKAFIVKQCTLRGGNVHIVVTCLRHNKSGRINIPLYDVFFPHREYEAIIEDAYAKVAMQTPVMPHVRYFITGGPEVVNNLLKDQNKKFLLYDRENLLKESKSVTVHDLENRVKEQYLDVLEQKLKYASSDLRQVFVSKVCKGDDKLLDFATAALNMPGSESLEEYCNTILNHPSGNTEAAILLHSLDKINKRGGTLAPRILCTVAPPFPALQEGIDMNVLRESMWIDFKNQNPDYKNFTQLYEKSVSLLEQFSLIHPDGINKSYYSRLPRNLENHVLKADTLLVPQRGYLSSILGGIGNTGITILGR